MHAAAEAAGGQVADPAVVVGHALAERLPAVAVAALEGDPHAGGGQPGGGVEDVGRQGAHGRGSLSSRSRVISRSSSATTPHSVSGSLPSRSRSAASSSEADRPLAETRNTWPKRSS